MRQALGKDARTSATAGKSSDSLNSRDTNNIKDACNIKIAFNSRDAFNDVVATITSHASQSKSKDAR